MISITRRFSFDAGHRIYGHESKCHNLHGHRYEAEITIVEIEDKLDNLGRVLDFGRIKSSIGGWIDRTLDHVLILEDKDPLTKILDFSLKDSSDLGRPPHIVDFPPTAENLAKYIFNEVKKILNRSFYALDVTSVKLFETANCWAEYKKGE